LTGVKVNFNWQDEFAATDVPQPLLSIENGPLMLLVSAIAGEPLLFTVTCEGGVEVDPTSQPPNATEAGLTVIAPEGAPVPLKATVRSPEATLALMVKTPVLLPIWDGVNVTWMAQVAPAATIVSWQLSVSAKSPLATTVPGVSATVPVFATVTVCVLLLVP
jgi:hypothetical protein